MLINGATYLHGERLDEVIARDVSSIIQGTLTWYRDDIGSFGVAEP